MDPPPPSPPTLFIFGGSGCLGRHLIKKYVGTHAIVNFSRDEHKHWSLDHEFGPGKITHVIGDANDPVLVQQALVQHNPDKVFILHALKHVDRCQENLHACITTNLLSVKNVLDTIHANVHALKRLNAVLFTSTDKAPAPISAYGMCKSLCEALMVEKSRCMSHVKFVIVRYGNVLNSTSSLLPALLRNKSDVYVLTDERMTRFWMSVEEACATIAYALDRGSTGEVIVPKLRAFRIKDMITYIAKLKGKRVETRGLRSAERLFEILINTTESMRTVLDDRGYYHVVPEYKRPELGAPFTVDSSMNVIEDSDELIHMFQQMNVVE